MKMLNSFIDTPEHIDLFAKGYDSSGQSPLEFSGAEINAKTSSAFESGVPSNFIQDGDMVVRLSLIDGWLQSTDFVTGVSGWRIRPTDVEFGNGYFRGDITGSSGTFSGTVSIGPATTYSTGYNPILKVNTFAQDAIPTSIAAGDLWIDTNDGNKLYRATAAGDTTIAAGHWTLFEDLNKTTTFAQAAIPTSTAIGDIWVDTDDGNKQYRAASIGADQITAGEWVLIQDQNKTTTFAQDAIPTSTAVGDTWVDTNDSNKLYRAASIGADQITAGEWILVNDLRAADAITKSGTSQALTGNLNLNTANVLLDGANKRIVISDGTNDRILIGYLAGKF